MNNAIALLQHEAHTKQSMSTSNNHTITKYSAHENAKLAVEFELAAKILEKVQNSAVVDGWIHALENMAKGNLA